MKIYRAELEEIIGILVGGAFWYVLTIVLMVTIPYFKIPSQVIIWVDMGLLILFMSAGHYLVSKGVINEKSKIEDLASIKSNLIGYFLWLIFLIFAYLLNIEISSNASIIGGYIIIFLIFLYMRNRALKRKGVSTSV
ncbi:hypothetical protein [Methanosarcina sp.]|uniref:hypothetical protein n=1 Tax=Methanosarcina sp. TaxID=2213 RepID=UPI0029890D57|nr:hypothetical protein [Methanosarcina sp.]MDW5549488.1 hypothetical protein [Methanosarcina sp.]MDW5553522.1 hypothetical protein [Methanosarcina sp.]MDW5558674.1 hypothetical protein [Methanosarcina sp.]